jgi:hypothetical protein
MSTRANIIVTDGHSELIFYRHSDGYPDGTLPTLNKFLDWVKERRIRDNVGQAAGWLILIGADEYSEYARERGQNALEPDKANSIGGWKCGAYEPTYCIHGDIAFLYVVDLQAKVIHINGQNGYRYHGQFSEPVEA